jgi:hypothetical protein
MVVMVIKHQNIRNGLRPFPFHSPDAQRRVGDAVTIRLRKPSERDIVMPRRRPTSGGRRTHGSPEATLGWETQSHLARGQPRMGDAVTACPMLGTCLPGQVNPTRKWKVCLQGLTWNAKSFVNLPCMGIVRGYL